MGKGKSKGRPTLKPGEMSASVHLRLPESQFDEVQRRCRSVEKLVDVPISMPDFLRIAVSDFLDRSITTSSELDAALCEHKSYLRGMVAGFKAGFEVAHKANSPDPKI